MVSGIDSLRILCAMPGRAGGKGKYTNTEKGSILSVAMLQDGGRPSWSDCMTHLKKSDPGPCALSPCRDPHVLVAVGLLDSQSPCPLGRGQQCSLECLPEAPEPYKMLSPPQSP